MKNLFKNWLTVFINRPIFLLLFPLFYALKMQLEWFPFVSFKSTILFSSAVVVSTCLLVFFVKKLPVRKPMLWLCFFLFQILFLYWNFFFFRIHNFERWWSFSQVRVLIFVLPLLSILLILLLKKVLKHRFAELILLVNIFVVLSIVVVLVQMIFAQIEYESKYQKYHLAENVEQDGEAGYNLYLLLIDSYSRS